MATSASLDEIRECVRKTIDECLAQILVDCPSVQMSSRQQMQLHRLVDEVSELFLDIRLRSR